MATENSHQAQHVIPLKNYLTVGAALLILTAFTVFVASIDLGPWNIVVALLIASAKATLVLLFFMHLFYDNKLYAFIFSAAIIILTLFIILIMFDTESRGIIYTESAAPIRAEALIYVDTTEDVGRDLALEAWKEVRAKEEYTFGPAIELYMKHCAVCHGNEGKGDGFNAYNLDPKPKSFSDSTVISKLTDDYLAKVIMEGGEGVGLTASMPPYKRNLSEKDVTLLIEFIQILSERD